MTSSTGRVSLEIQDGCELLFEIVSHIKQDPGHFSFYFYASHILS